MKEIKFVTLTSEQLFAFCEVLDAIGIEAFAEIFDKKQLTELKEQDKEEEEIGMVIGAKLLKVLVKNLPKAKKQIYSFLSSCVEDMTAQEIETLPLAQFMKLIKDFALNPGMKDFFTEAVSLFKGE